MKQRLLLTLAAIFVALSSWAYGTEINGIYYVLDSSTETARVTCTGSGVSGDYNPASTAYTGSVTIPSSVTYDGITYSVTSIGNLAFTDCTGLTSVNIPNSVTKIGSFSFDGCSGLTSINIPNSVTTIGKAAFQNCKGLTSINIPNSVTSIEDYTFTYCSELTSINIPNSVTTIGYAAFYECYSLESITIGNSVTTIGDYAFCYCNSYYLTSLTIPNSVTTIGEHAFSNCNWLKSITIGNSVTTIGEYAFYSCPVTSITIPSSVTSIGKSAFSSYNYNNSLTSIEVEAGNTVYDSRNDCNAIIETASNTLLFGCKNTTIPSSVTSIGDGAFYGCHLTSITIPSSVTSIGKDAFTIGYLTSIEVEAGNPVYDSRDNCNAIIETASNKLIIGCKNTTIPSTVTIIGDNAFNGADLTSITIPNSVTTIGDGAFHYTDLTSITIPNSVTSIGVHAFYYCKDLTSITIGNSVTTIGEGAFADCLNLASIKVEAGNTTYDSRENCNALIETASNTLIVGGNKATIPSSVTTIGRRAFSFRKGLTSITIPNSVTSIVPEAFYVCYDLTTVTIPESVTSIGYDAFRGCESLTDIYALRTDPEAYQCDTHTFESVPFSTCTLHVPVGSKEAYASTAPWSNFTNIVEEDFTGIQPITLNPSEAGQAYYNLQGQRITTPQRGQIVIVRYSDGTSRKMLVQ